MIATTLLPEPNGSALGNIARFTLERAGRTYRRLRFQVQGVGAGTGGTGTVLDFRNVVEYVRVLVNSVEVMRFNPKEKRCHADIYNVNGDSLGLDFMDIPLAIPGLKDSDWPTGKMKSFQVELKLVAALPVPGGTPNPLNSFTGVIGWGMWEPWPDADLGDVVTLQTHSPAVGAVGWNKVQVIPALDNIASIKSIFLIAPAVAPDLVNAWARTNISAVKVLIGGVEIFDQTKAANDEALSNSPFHYTAFSNGVRGFFIPFDLTGKWQDYMPLLDSKGRRMSFELQYEIASGATPERIDLLIEGVKPGASAPSVA